MCVPVEVTVTRAGFCFLGRGGTGAGCVLEYGCRFRTYKQRFVAGRSGVWQVAGVCGRSQQVCVAGRSKGVWQVDAIQVIL